MPPKYELGDGEDLTKIAEQLERMTGAGSDDLVVRSDAEKIADDAAGVSPDAPRPVRTTEKTTPAWVNVLLGVAVLAVLVSGTFVVMKLVNRPTTTAMVTVPDVSGLTPPDADAKLREVGLKASVKYDPASSQPDGTILSTTPPAGTPVEKGAVVTLLVAKKGATTPPGPGRGSGPGTRDPVPGTATRVAVPDVDAKARVQAEADIKKAGLTPKVDFSRSDANLPADTVIMTNPAKGLEVERGSTVTLYVNRKGGGDGGSTQVIPLPEVITLKDYTGLSAAVVEKELRDLGLSPKLEYQVTRVQAPQHVISTNPPAGIQVSPKALIRVLVARQ